MKNRKKGVKQSPITVFLQRAKRFFKNDIYTLIVAVSIVFLATGVPLATLTA